MAGGGNQDGPWTEGTPLGCADWRAVVGGRGGHWRGLTADGRCSWRKKERKKEKDETSEQSVFCSINKTANATIVLYDPAAPSLGNEKGCSTTMATNNTRTEGQMDGPRPLL